MVSNSEPCVLIYGPEATVVGTIIHYLAGAQAERHSLSEELAVSYWPWRVDNRYYSADVRLCHVQRCDATPAPDATLAQHCEAIIICFDSHQADGLAEVDAILSLTKESEPDVCLLVCETCSGDTPVSRLQAQEWCVGHGFELVELAPAEEADPDGDDDFPETTGVQRIAQALHAHTWSNLQMKDHQPAISNKLADELTAERVRDSGTSGGGGGTSGSGELSQVSQPAAAEDQQTSAHGPSRPPDLGQPMDQSEDQQTSASVDTLVTELAGLMGSGSSGGDDGADGAGDGDGDDGADGAGDGDGDGGGDGDEAAGGLEDFELLFSQLAELRAAAARAPADQRHELAERVAMAFLRSMGADEDAPGEDSD